MRILDYVIILVEKLVSLNLDIAGLSGLPKGLQDIRTKANTNIQELASQAKKLCVQNR